MQESLKNWRHAHTQQAEVHRQHTPTQQAWTRSTCTAFSEPWWRKLNPTALWWGMVSHQKWLQMSWENNEQELHATSFSESLWIIYTRITEPECTTGDHGWEKWHDQVLTFLQVQPHSPRLEFMVPEEGDREGWRWWWALWLSQRETLWCPVQCKALRLPTVADGVRTHAHMRAHTH